MRLIRMSSTPHLTLALGSARKNPVNLHSIILSFLTCPPCFLVRLVPGLAEQQEIAKKGSQGCHTPPIHGLWMPLGTFPGRPFFDFEPGFRFFYNL